MSLRILFADDSVTAQNMGKRILIDAGYDVVAVSNGAAAVKKIAEQKPDIIILDVYMPGYTGLEVCEKVRGSMETLNTPVLLTVGKMEPYKPEEANRVRADGVIVKPFEASDLLAIVKKFEERIGQASAPPMAPHAILQERLNEASPSGPAPQPPVVARPAQPAMEAPAHVAASSAFSDSLAADPSHSFDQLNVNFTGASSEAAPRTASRQVSIPDYELPVMLGKEVDQHQGGTTVASSAAAHLDPAPDSTPIRPRQIPIYQDGDEQRMRMEVVHQASAPTGEIEISRDPRLRESDAESTRPAAAESKEAGLVPTTLREAEAASVAAAEAAELACIKFAHMPGVDDSSRCGETRASEPPPRPRLVARAANLDAVETKNSESALGARVTPAIATYTQATSMPSVKEQDASVFEDDPQVAAVQIRELTESAPGDATSRPDSADLPDPQAIAAQIEGADVGAAEVESSNDHSNIAQAVHRVIERMKPELVEEIVKELKNKR